MANSYKDLLVWRKAKAPAVEVYRATEQFPRSELFGLTSQMRRSAVSIASNIAEGQGRGSKRDFVNFLCMSRGSLLELQTQLEIAEELGMGKATELGRLREECYAVLGLLNSLKGAIETKARV